MTTQSSPVAQTNLGAPTLRAPKKSLRVACILDGFSFSCFAPEGDFAQLTPKNWKAELEELRPDFLLVESAWRGVNNLWTNILQKCGPEIRGIINWCKQNGVPTAFWNKEDPVHFNYFLKLASLFDAVFTTDVANVARYKIYLGHDRVEFLPFAAQVRTHNPLELYDRIDGMSFAGSYYAKYPERTAALESFMRELTPLKPLVIFDRNYGGTDKSHAFPDEYHPYIAGKLDADEIDISYKGFTTGINLNSVNESQTMLARRVYELAASNTLVVSNYSPSLPVLFGDLVLASDSGEEVARKLRKLQADPLDETRIRAQALRKVLREHTYEIRMRKICQTLGFYFENQTQTLCLIARVENEQELRSVLASAKIQTRQPDQIVIITDQSQSFPTLERVSYVSPSLGAKVSARVLAAQTDFIAVFDPEDYYGPSYLEDLTLGFTYVESDVIAKNPAFVVQDDVISHEPRTNYVLSDSIEPRRAVFKMTNSLTFEQLVGETPKAFTGLVIDEFEYVEAGAAQGESAERIAGAHFADEGYSLESLESRAANAVIAAPKSAESPFDILAFARTIPEQSAKVKLKIVGQEVWLDSRQGEIEFCYLKSQEFYAIRDFGWGGSTAMINFGTTLGLDVMLTVVFFDAGKNRLSHLMTYMNFNREMEIPKDAVYLQFWLRVEGPGKTRVAHILPYEFAQNSTGLLSRAKICLLTNVYPSYEDPYSNAFVHSRVRTYQEVGLEVDVLCVNDVISTQFREFEGVNVMTLNATQAERLIRDNQIGTVLVHFLEPEMWEFLKKPDLGAKIHIWIHGSEVQPWWRRDYDTVSYKQLTSLKQDSNRRMNFWRNVFFEVPECVDFIFASNYIAESTMPDVGIRLPEEKYAIIPNPIDTTEFEFHEKGPEQRLKVLSIRPYNSRKYANDLSVEAVLDLKDEPYFADLEFLFIGEGQFFDEILKPIRDLPNVTCQRGFLRHAEIAALHKEFGVFLSPTRMDGQGVSRDEAMSSGLVPITSAVAAVPEFVDEESGFLAAEEDSKGLADAIRTLYYDPDRFIRMSHAAAARVQRQAGKPAVARAELDLILGIGNGRPEGYPFAGADEEAQSELEATPDSQAEVDEDPADDPNRPLRIFLYGSCVARDMLDYFPDDFELMEYIARQSWISATNPPLEAPLKTNLTSPFQQRLVKGDLESNALVRLEAAEKADVVLLDLVDERFGVHQFGDGFCTPTLEYLNSGWADALGKPSARLEFGSQKHFDLWAQSANEVKQALLKFGLWEKTYVVRSPFVALRDDGQEVKPGYKKTSAEWNKRYTRYFDYLETLEFQFVSIPPESHFSAVSHKWGASYYHYVDSAYVSYGNELIRKVRGE